MKFPLIALACVVTFASQSAIAAPHPDCKGLYVGKTYYFGSGKWKPQEEAKIVGIDKDEQLVTILIVQDNKTVEFEGCKKFKDAVAGYKG